MFTIQRGADKLSPCILGIFCFRITTIAPARGEGSQEYQEYFFHIVCAVQTNLRQLAVVQQHRLTCLYNFSIAAVPDHLSYPYHKHG